MLRHLPNALHYLVVACVFPPKDSGRTLTLSCDFHHYETLLTVLHAPQLSYSFQILHGVNLSSQSTNSLTLLEVLRITQVPLSHLSFHIQMDVPALAPEMPLPEDQFWSDLLSTNTLTNLDLTCGVSVKHAPSAALHKAVELSGLQRLAVHVWGAPSYHLPASLSTLTLLKSLELDCRHDLRGVPLSSLFSLQHLRTLHLCPIIEGHVSLQSKNNNLPAAKAPNAPSILHISLTSDQLEGCSSYLSSMVHVETFSLTGIDSRNVARVAKFLKILCSLQHLSLAIEVVTLSSILASSRKCHLLHEPCAALS